MPRDAGNSEQVAFLNGVKGPSVTFDHLNGTVTTFSELVPGEDYYLFDATNQFVAEVRLDPSRLREVETDEHGRKTFGVTVLRQSL